MRAALSILLLAISQLSAIAAAQERPGPVPAPNKGSSQIYITRVTVIDTESGKEAQDGTVIILGDRISEVRDSKDGPPFS